MSGRLEVIRGRRARAGLQGLRGVSLSTMLDLIWAEIWDDCSPMGDTHQYHEIVYQLYWEGKDATEIYYSDAKGKRKPLSEMPQKGKNPTASAREEMAAMQARAAQLAEANELASSPNGRR